MGFSIQKNQTSTIVSDDYGSSYVFNKETDFKLVNDVVIVSSGICFTAENTTVNGQTFGTTLQLFQYLVDNNYFTGS